MVSPISPPSYEQIYLEPLGGYVSESAAIDAERSIFYHNGFHDPGHQNYFTTGNGPGASPREKRRADYMIGMIALFAISFLLGIITGVYAGITSRCPNVLHRSHYDENEVQYFSRQP